MQKTKLSESQILLVGLGLIGLVTVVTVYQAGYFSFASKKEKPETEAVVQEDVLPYQTILVKDLQNLIQKKQPLTLLDIRSFDEYIQEHILDSVNIPLEEFPAAAKIDPKKPVVVIAATGDDPKITEVVEALKKETFTDVKVLAGGMLIWVSQLGATITYGNPDSFQDQAKVDYITPEQVNERLNKKESLSVVDIRSQGDFSAGHIPGAINIPFEEIEKRREDIDVTKKIIVVGTNEVREFQAAVQINDIFFMTPSVMKGAMPRWKELNFPLAK